jgi:FlaA1/EpsC-like NDP-sugar epimerase
VTVTDERMTRFFMTIPEAVRLVIQAGAMGAGGETFVLDMGDPVRIVDLAREMIRLSGLVPDRDIEIVFTGNRGAEKLDEKLFNDGEQVVGTTHPKIAMAVRRPLPRALLKQELTRIRVALDEHDLDEALRVAHEVVSLTGPAGAAPPPHLVGPSLVAEPGGDTPAAPPAAPPAAATPPSPAAPAPHR